MHLVYLPTVLLLESVDQTYLIVITWYLVSTCALRNLKVPTYPLRMHIQQMKYTNERYRRDSSRYR